jgi:hypothetical protein
MFRKAVLLSWGADAVDINFGAVNFAQSSESATLTLSERSGVGFLVHLYAEVFFGPCRQLRCSKSSKLLIS